ncbi:MAG: hypothetical protein JWN08_2356, partial [Frankiales bacterium]|nr:hypothetical protein [Frankiales bacterium]
PTAGDRPPAVSAGALPRTGADLLVALAAGLVLVAGGSVVLSSRRRAVPALT